MKRMTALLAVLIALALPATSLASGGSNCQAYNPQLCGAVNAGSTNDAASSGTLPFTGINVSLLMLAGGSFLGAGLVVRRLARDIS